MSKFIYLITSPSSKIYVGQSTVPIKEKEKWYIKLEKYDKTDRKIANAIKKYGWQNMKFEVIEQDDNWTKEQLNEREIFWIQQYDAVNKGYNMTTGGDGVDSALAQKLALRHHRLMSPEKKAIRSVNCSKGQKQRYAANSDTNATKQRKSNAHKGTYIIESPDGRIWETKLGLKDFAKIYENEIQITYWALFNAYRKCYSNVTTQRARKDNNKWKVTRLD